MEISSTYSQNLYNPQFKATFPVAIWVRESNGSFAPIARRDVVGPLQERLVLMLNNPLLTKNGAKELKKSVKNHEITERTASRRLTEIMSPAAQNLRAYLSSCDPDYRNSKEKTKVRSFYNNVSGNINNPYTVSYIISGGHVSEFNNRFGKEIGRANRAAKEIKQEMLQDLHKKYEQACLSGNITDETREQYNKETERIKGLVTEGQRSARKKYNQDGLRYVNDYTRRVKDSGSTQVLHTKFEIIRDKDGKFVDYQFLDARFLPEFGPESPFEKLKRFIP